MLKKIITTYFIFFFTFNSYSSEFSFNKRMRFLKAELIKLTNDETKNSQDYLEFLNNEIDKVEKKENPYHENFTDEELQKTKDYLLKVKKIFEYGESEVSPGIFKGMWDWLVGYLPYLGVGALTIGSFFLGYFYSPEKEDPPADVVEGEQNQSVIPSKRPILSPKFGSRPSWGFNDHAKSKTNSRSISNLSWHPDPSYLHLLSSSYDHTVRVFDILNHRPGKFILNYAHGLVARSSTWVDKGRYVVSTSYNEQIKVTNIFSKKFFYLNTGHTSCNHIVKGSPDGKYLASGPYECGGSFQIWDLTSRKIKFSFKVENSTGDISWAPDSQSIVFANGNDWIRWKMSEDNYIETYKGHADEVFSVAWGPNKSKNYIASSAADNTIRVWDVNLKKNIFIGKHNDYTFSVSFSPDGKYIVSGSCDKTAKIWDISTQKELTSLKFSSEVSAVAWSPDGRYIAVGLFNGIIEIWPVIYSQ